MDRTLTVISYYALCMKHHIDFAGIHKIQTSDTECGVVISPDVVDCVAPVLIYKFGGIPIHNNSEGLVALWDIEDRDDRDRFYTMCAYLLRSVCPDLWR